MDELELLKKDWKKNDGQFKQVSENEIYGMLHKSSSSIVKWIFIISVLEIILWPILALFVNNNSYWTKLESYHLKTFWIVVSVVNYIVIAYFIYKFYINYKKINATDSINHLLENILNSRKTVKYYMSYNLIMMAVLLVIVCAAQITYEPEIQKIITQFGENSNKGYYIILGAYFIIITIATLTLWLFYKLIYGFLIKRLNKNYKELQKIEN